MAAQSQETANESEKPSQTAQLNLPFGGEFGSISLEQAGLRSSAKVTGKPHALFRPLGLSIVDNGAWSNIIDPSYILATASSYCPMGDATRNSKLTFNQMMAVWMSLFKMVPKS